MHTLLAFLQSTAIDPIAQLPGMGVGGALGLITLYVYREDRKRSDDDRKRSEESLKDLAENFRQIVQENTKAITELREALRIGIIK